MCFLTQAGLSAGSNATFLLETGGESVNASTVYLIAGLCLAAGLLLSILVTIAVVCYIRRTRGREQAQAAQAAQTSQPQQHNGKVVIP